MSDTSLRARGVSEIVDAAFALYRRNALQYIVLAAIATAPSLIISLLYVSTPPTTMAELWRYLPGSLTALLAYTLVGALVFQMGSDVYLGREPDIGRIMREALVRLPALIAAMLITFVLTFVASLFFLVPGVFVFLFLFATSPVIVLEKKGVFAGMARSARLVRGRKAHVFGTLALLFGIYFVFSIGFSIGAAVTGSNIVTLIVSSLFSVVASPLINLGVMVLYYDLRIRSEGFDVEHMSALLDSVAQPAPSMGASPA